MLGSRLQTFAARLCLLAAVLVGTLPGRGMVLCLEPDGCISLEVALGPNRCEGCPPDCASDESGEAAQRADDPDSCPCTDVPIGTASQAIKIKPKLADLDVHLAATTWPVCSVIPELGDGTSGAALRPARPRPPPALTLLEGIVLLV